MAATAPPSDQVAGMLDNLSLDSQSKIAEISESAKKAYGNNEAVMYPQGYGYTHLGTYPSPDLTAPTMGNDVQQYGTEHYQYPTPFYQIPNANGTHYYHNSGSVPQTEAPTSAAGEKETLSVPTAAGNPNTTLNGGNLNKSNGSKPFRPSDKKSCSSFNSSYKRGGLPTGYSPGYHGYDQFLSPVPWLDASMYSNGPAGHAINNGFSSHLNLHHTRPIPGFAQAPGSMNMMYPNNRMYSQYGYKAGAGFGAFGGNSWTNGRGWVVVDNKFRHRSRSYGNENMDGLSELNRGPRSKGFKNQQVFPPAQAQNLPLTENNVDNLAQVPDKEQYNKEDFPEDYSNAKFFVIKSYSEDDVHKSIKYGVWASTPNGNKKLDAAYNEAQENPGTCPVFLLFSVNTSGQFVGLAEMMGSVDFNKTVGYWQQEKWTGCFPVKWHIIKDIPNSSLRHITLENNENKPVTNSRDTQEVVIEKGIEIVKIFKGHKGKTSILDDFGFYATRERIIQEKRAKQKIQKQALDGKAVEDLANDKENFGNVGEEKSPKPTSEEFAGAAMIEVGKVKGPNSAVETSPEESSESKDVSSVAASAC